MRSFTIMAAFLANVLVSGVSCAADVGDIAPEFSCLDDQGQIWKSRDHIGKWPVVIFFYPSDFSFCCTRQAVCYRNTHEELEKECLEVIGISGDAVEAHRLFKKAHALKYTLLSDDKGLIARQFNVPLREGGKAMAVGDDGQTMAIPRKFTSARWTFIIGVDGRILHRDSGPSPMKDSQVVLEFIKKGNEE